MVTFFFVCFFGLFCCNDICNFWCWKLVQLFLKFFDSLIEHLFVLCFGLFELTWPWMIVVIYQSNIVSWSFLCILLPFSTFLHDLIFFEIEMSSNNSLKSFWWVSNIFNHSELDIGISDNVWIGFIFLLTFLCSLLIFKTRFIEINLFAHNDSLDW